MRLSLRNAPIKHRPTPSGRCFSFAYCGSVVRLRLQHCPVKRPTLVEGCKSFRIYVGRVVACAPTPALSKDQPRCGCLLQACFSFRLYTYPSSILLRLFARKQYLSRIFWGENIRCRLAFGCGIVCCSNTLLYPACILGCKSLMVGLFLIEA